MAKRTMEFQGVVLCGGYGTRMPELTDDVPKALLPVANVPIFWYALNVLQSNNIYDVLVLANEKCYSRIQQLLSDGSLPPLPNLNIEVINTGAHGRNWGTIQALAQVQEKIKADIVVMSGDVVCDLNLRMMLEQHRSEDATMTVLLAENAITSTPPGPKRIHGKYRDFSILPADEDPPKLLYLVPEEDFEDIAPKSELFMRNANVCLSSRYKNCNIFIIKKGVVTLLRNLDETFTSLNTDFIPYILEAQNGPRDKVVNDMVFGKKPNAENSDSDSDPEDKIEDNRIRCYAYLAKVSELSTMAHCNTAGPYFAINKFVAHNPKMFFTPDMISHLNLNAHLTGVDTHSSVHRGVTLAQNIKISGSVIMRGSKIGAGSHIHNSILMENVTVGENCNINNAIICSKQIIADGEKVSNEIQKTIRNMELD